MMQRLIIFSVMFMYSAICFSADWIPERRKDQNPTQPAHIVFPLPYSKPGIGDGIVFLGTVSNLYESTADISVLLVTGDAKGSIINGSEVPLYSDFLFLDFYLQDIDRVGVNNYAIRGIDNSDKDDFTILDVSVAKEFEAELNLTFYDRRLNFYYFYSDFEFQIDSIKDNNGDLITTLGEPFINSGPSGRFRLSADITDDYLDPRKGFRLDASYQDHKAGSREEVDFYTLNFNVLGYVPIDNTDTLVLNYYQSDAHVRRQGDIDPANIRAELDSNCAPTDTECLTTEQELVDNLISARTNGTAQSLGGDLRLRSFPQERYQGAHMAFFGVEYRWNFTQEVKPFNYFIWKDVRTGMQVAFFAEIGSVSETSSALWDEKKHSVGAGFRLVAASGAVYRADIATGDEGVEVVIIFDYPWE